MLAPTWHMASITSSTGILDSIPAKAMSAAMKAKLAPMALRLTQGTSTKPATGSQMRPSIFLMTKAIA
ncbi:Uncharacterised protein [Streptococcus pneumoniae]|nr:Uncharacterised protein [Streptococcus pneumoniae]